MNKWIEPTPVLHLKYDILYHYVYVFNLLNSQRNPKMELSKNDLLKLVTYFEGEIQARDIAIAALKVNICINFIWSDMLCTNLL